MELLAAHHAQVMSRQHRLQSLAHQHGLYLKRSRRRVDYGTYGLYHVETRKVAVTREVESMDGYGLDLDDVEKLLTERDQQAAGDVPAHTGPAR